MGYLRCHAILVTGRYDSWAEKAHTKAEMILPGLVSNIVEGRANGERSFFVAPDGSKEGWEESDIGDAQRAIFVKWLNEQKYDDGSSPLSWALVQYGDDNGETKIISHDDEKALTEETEE